MGIFTKKVKVRRIDSARLKEAESSMREIDVGEFERFIEEGDTKLKELMSVMSWPTWDLILDQKFRVIYDNKTKNLYVGCVACRRELEEPAREYLSEEVPDGKLAEIIGYIPGGKLTSGPSTSVCFAKQFEGGVIQFITFGQWWASARGYGRAMFGHIIQKDERPYRN